MDSQEIIHRAADFVKTQLPAEGSHDWWHVWRVWQLAKRIAEAEGAEQTVVELAALLHDIADWKFSGDEQESGKRAAEFLATLSIDPQVIAHVVEIIDGISFKGAGVETPMRTTEGKCVQDADRLDALGAIGIARCFAYGGSKGRPIYDPEVKPELHGDFSAYQKSIGSSLNHFHEKLLLLKDRMQTATGKKLAEERHAYLEQFLAQFLKEWNGAEVPPGAYQHYKGGKYEVFGTGKHSETGEELVVYRGADGQLWVRPKGIFTKDVGTPSDSAPRFRFIDGGNM